MDAERIKKGFRRSLNHTSQPVPFIKELFDAKAKVEDRRIGRSYEALTLMPIRYISFPYQVEVEGEELTLIFPDECSGLCFWLCYAHETWHVIQVYSPEGFRI